MGTSLGRLDCVLRNCDRQTPVDADASPVEARRKHLYTVTYPPSSLPHNTLTSDNSLIIMDVSFAITGKGYVILAADTTVTHSIIKVKNDEDKIKALGPHLLMAYSGEPGKSEHRFGCG